MDFSFARGLSLLSVLTLGVLVGCSGGEPGEGDPDSGVRKDTGAPCQNTCDTAGAKECRGLGFRQCGDFNGDGCIEWSDITDCGPGDSCVSGQCANCQNDCAEGNVQCGGNGGVQRCVTTGDADPCFEWGAEEACPAGEMCSGNECRSDCIDECGEGSPRCNGDDVQTCSRGASGCLAWGAPMACPAGESCSLGTCRDGECANECEAGSQRCQNNGFETCGNYDGDECTEWSQVTLCENGDVCSNGQCAGECADECGAMGARQCSGNGVQVCGNNDGDDCLEWGAVAPCADGQECSDGLCRGACIDECVADSVQCQGNGVQNCGDFDDDACLEWSETVACDMAESCSNGECTVECQNECLVLNARQCQGNGVQTCGNTDADPCLEWGVAVDCPGGQACAGGECAANCVDECVERSAQCSGNGVQTCGNFDADACREWSAVTPCPNADVCSNGVCGAACDDECVMGTTRCGANGLQNCGNFDDDSCNDWGPAEPCPAGESCSNGECAAECNDECQRGAQRCQGEGFQVCGDFDPDECSEWSGATPCPELESCSNGLCVMGCDDECVAGSTRCADNGFQRCGNSDADDCQEWSASVPCPADTVCSNGECAPFCINECDEGASRCGDGGVQVCGDFDNDECREWSSGVACPGNQVCANGACAGQCADECMAGELSCDGSRVLECGEFDGDACTEWSVGLACADGESCDAGRCVPSVVGCGVDDDCAGGLICVFGECSVSRGCAADDDCFEGESCDIAGVCRPMVDSGIGTNCMNDNDCLNGLSCLPSEDGNGGVCTVFCLEGICPTGSTCYQLDLNDAESLFCLDDCADVSGCEDGQTCVQTGAATGGACIPAGCANDDDCDGGALCVDGSCRVAEGCDPATGEGCGMGEACVVDNGVGICLAPCQVIGANDCPAGEQCVAADNDNGGFCVPLGMGAVNEDCESFRDCGAGLMCINDGLGNNRCLTVCDTLDDNACGAGQQCLSVGGRAGACIGDCENECNPDSIQCAGNSVQACGQADNDICLEFEAPVACPNGSVCSELEGGCAEGCANDADCANGLLPTTCNNGACELVSECDAGTGMGCNGADQCFAADEAGTIGVCLEPCEVLAGQCSDAAESCGLFGGGQGFCIATGDTPNGGMCDSSADCANGACLLVEEGNDVGACFGLCDVNMNDCDAGEVCQGLGIDGQLGVCAPGCVDECLAGAQRCGINGGIEVCEDGPAGCLVFGAEAECPGDEVCDPANNICADPNQVGCQNDMDCEFDDNVPRICNQGTRECELPACTVADNDCGAGQTCVPEGFEMDGSPSVAGLCLNDCSALASGECGTGSCGDYPVNADSVTFVCLPGGNLGIFDACEGIVGCQDGLSCIGFEDGNFCVERCDVAQAGASCTQVNNDCIQPGFFPNGVGICLPQQ